MATTPDYIEFVAERLASTGNVRYRKMFGEYMVYVNEKPLVLVCDDTAFVKMLPCLDALMLDAERGFPYDGAKEHYILDVENADLAGRVVAELDKVTPIPKPRVKKPPSDVAKIKSFATGETIPVERTAQSSPAAEHVKLKFKSVTDEYIYHQPPKTQILLLNVRETIRAALPDATEKISYQMPTFWKGRNLIHFAAMKNHLGIYPGAAAMEHFTPRLTGYKTSKGAIQFPYKTFGNEQLALISEIAVWCGKEYVK
ncbi:hypothetical protein FACS1894171_2600 [Clostridia bacterium]|nr:hypothetical protein FACS1894171_2600 [Clostridia bacterium]